MIIVSDIIIILYLLLGEGVRFTQPTFVKDGRCKVYWNLLLY